MSDELPRLDEDLDLSKHAPGWAWDDRGSYHGSNRYTLDGPEGWHGILAYDPEWVETGICNVSRIDGVVCRLYAGHPGKHIPFSGELICQTGVWVKEIVHEPSG